MVHERNIDDAQPSPQSARRERRRAQAVPASTSNEAMIASCVKVARDAQPGSGRALEAAQQAIFMSIVDTMQALQPALAPLLTADDPGDPAATRKSWIAKVRFLNGCLALPDLQGLSIALQELERGVTAEALRPCGNMQGGKSGTEKLRLMAYVVEAADELKRRCAKDEAYREELKASEASYSTVEKYRKKICDVPEFAPRLGWRLHWQEEPEVVLQRLIWAIKSLEKNT
ncbi:hypothetical protein [Novosphingobium sp. SG707]|uniref:hypothetical protein n=1 Tax=Novosphingobium sp. SG707 TaxID=2586996 RepID=UPI0014458A9A|nr:hypothetical protein [Novosphingobium sp. SG707]NKJ02777.1 hypothetical protein [Novosphingobium sp. SG707]